MLVGVDSSLTVVLERVDGCGISKVRWYVVVFNFHSFIFWPPATSWPNCMHFNQLQSIRLLLVNDGGEAVHLSNIVEVGTILNDGQCNSQK